MAVDEVTNWFTKSTDNPSPIPPGPDGRRPRRVGLSMQEMMSAIARWRDTLSGVTGSVILRGADPRFSWDETDVSADNKYWDILPVSEQLRFRAVNDAQNVFTNWLTVDRTGTTIDQITLAATTISLTGDVDPGGTVDGRDIDADGTALDTHIALTAEHVDWAGAGAENIHADRFDNAPVASVFGRSGAVTAEQADYDGFFLTPSEGNSAYLGISAKAADSELIDGVDILDLARTDIAETFDDDLRINGDIGFYNTTPAAKPTITGVRDSNAALASLLTELATLGLLTDSTTES